MVSCLESYCSAVSEHRVYIQLNHRLYVNDALMDLHAVCSIKDGCSIDNMITDF